MRTSKKIGSDRRPPKMIILELDDALGLTEVAGEPYRQERMARHDGASRCLVALVVMRT